MMIGRKFALWTVSILLAASAMIAILFYTFELRDAAAKFDLLGTITGRVIEDSLVVFMQRRDTAGLDRKLEAIQAGTETIDRILLLNGDRVVKAGTDKDLVGTIVPVSEAELPARRTGGSGGFRRNRDNRYRWEAAIENRPVCHACHSPAGRNNGSLIIDFSLAVFQRHVREQVVAGFIIISLSMIAIGVVMVVLSKLLITRRLERMAAAMTAYRQGDASASTPVEGRDEITHLETNFNEMAGAITAREEERDALSVTINEQLRFLQQLIDTIPMPVFYKNVNGAYLGCNRAFEEFLGLPKETLVGKSVYDIAPKELAGEYHRRDRELFDDPGIQRYEFSVRHADGTDRNVIFSKATYADAGGNVAGLLGVMQDITDRKRSEQEREKLIVDLRNALNMISRSYKEWQDTFDSITDLIAILDKDFTVLKVNLAFSAHFGLHPRDMIGRKCYEFFHESMEPILNCPHRTTLLEKREASEEVLDKRTNKVFRITTFPYSSPGGDILGSIHVARDITSEREREMRLIMSERLAALGQMASGIAHEINNPLASIAGCSEGLLSRVRKEQYEATLFETYLNIIQEEVFRCKNITTAMLSFVRKTTYEKKDINLSEMVDKTLEIISFQGRLKYVEVIRRFPDQMVLIHGNEGELRQVLLAVITNALDAMNDKGSLTLETATRDAGAVIRITDTGPGIPADIRTKIFDPFFTTKSERGGTGLGLSIARKIVLNHNGTIDVASEPGTGTAFTITLPR